MDTELEVIHDEMEQTRASLADKLGALENQVRETVSGATDAVNSTVEGVKEVVGTVSDTVESVTETFNVSKHVEDNPWLAFGAAVAAGVVLSQLVGAGRAASPQPAVPPDRHWEPQTPQEPAKQEESLLGSVGSGTMEAIESMMPDVKGVMNTVVSGLGGLAVGTVMSVIRQLAAEAVPAEWKGEVTKLVNQVSDQIRPAQQMPGR